MELLPCPFCGGKAELSESAIAVEIFCGGCACSVGAFFPGEKARAVNEWNRRDAIATLLYSLSAIITANGEAMASMGEGLIGLSNVLFEHLISPKNPPDAA